MYIYPFPAANTYSSGKQHKAVPKVQMGADARIKAEREKLEKEREESKVMMEELMHMREAIKEISEKEEKRNEQEKQH